MSIAAPTVIGTAGTSVTGSTQTVTLTAGASVGDLIVVHFGGSNGRTLNSVTDTQSNTWNLGTGFSQTTVADSDWAWSILTTALTTSDTISTTLSGNASHAVEVIRCTSTTGWDSSPVDASATAGSVGATSVSVGPTGTTAQNDELSLLLVGTGGAVASWTATSPYTTLGNAASTGTIRHALSAYRVLTATSAETAAGTLGTSRAWAGVVTTFRAAATGGTLYTRTGADTASASDALGRTIKLNTTTAETVTGSDALTRTISLKTTTANTVSGTDSLGRLIVLNKTGSDTASASDAAVSQRIRIRGIADTASASDSLARTIKLVRANSDTAPVSTDSATGSGGNSRSALDTASATDSADRAAMSKIRTSADTAGASDALTANQLFVRAISESLTTIDILIRAALLQIRSSSESLTISDAATRAAITYQRASSDSTSISDAVSIGNAAIRTASDYGVNVTYPDPILYPGGLPGPVWIAEVASRALLKPRSLADSAPAADSVSKTYKTSAQVFEFLTISDIAYQGALGPAFSQHGGKITATIQEPSYGVSVTTPVYSVAVVTGNPSAEIFVYLDYFVGKPSMAAAQAVADGMNTELPSPTLYPSGTELPGPPLIMAPSDAVFPAENEYLRGNDYPTAGLIFPSTNQYPGLYVYSVPVSALIDSPYTVIFTGNPVAVITNENVPVYAGIEE